MSETLEATIVSIEEKLETIEDEREKLKKQIELQQAKVKGLTQSIIELQKLEDQITALN